MRNRILMGLIVVWVATILLRIIYLGVPLDNDEGAYMYIGSMWVKGEGLPYIDVFDHKMPLVYILYSPLVLISSNVNWIRIMATLWSMATIGIYYVFLVNKLGKRWGIWGAIVICFLFSSYNLEAMPISVESWALPFVGLGILLGEKRWGGMMKPLYWGGVIAAIFLLKPSILLIIFPNLIKYLSECKTKLNAMLLTSLGAILPVGLGVIYFWINGGLSQLYWANFTYNKLYVWYSFFCGAECLKFSSIFRLIFEIGSVHLALLWIGVMVAIFFGRRLGKGKYIWSLIGTAYLYSRLGGYRLYAHYFLFLIFPLVWINMETIKILSLKRREWSGFISFFIIGFAVIWEIVSGPGWTIKPEPKKWDNYWYYRGFAALDVSQHIWLKNDESLLSYTHEPEIYVYMRRKAPDENINLFAFRYKFNELAEWRKKMWAKKFDYIVTYSEQHNKLMAENVPWEWSEMKDYDVFYRNEFFLVFKRRANQI